MSKIAVVYKSKYGSSKKYAEWIADELKAELFEHSKIKKDDLLKYDTIIYGGGLYAGSISGISLITKNFDKLKDKNLIVFTVGTAQTDNTEVFKPIIEKNCSEEVRRAVKFFHFRGSMDYKNMTLTHKMMMKMLKLVLEKKKEEGLSKEDKLFLETFGQKVDFIDKAYISPLIEYVNALS
ncbi:MAG TPA: flavodoxin domain-containing protein [Defluviitaleaceae bacterium]|nr:flavodoxin domain-containing protein [Defluviitaleaceae bacterium]HPT75884.1 flavodoxin domain-containing protein [Defluviitaleaceae bacterium]HQD51136.1 flavodoxin domain-containing protein [Defluviitaleaceae bacterium]